MKEKDWKRNPGDVAQYIRLPPEILPSPIGAGSDPGYSFQSTSLLT